MWNNKLVIFLPLTVMIVLFAFGYYSIMGADEVTNEDLDARTELYLDIDDTENRVTAGWNWETMPGDGVIGTDYIEIILYDEDNNPVGVDVNEAELQLLQGADEIYSIDEIKESTEGILFSFPNMMEDNLTYGNSGSINMTFDAEEDVAYGEVRYAHTWTHGSSLESGTLAPGDVSFSNGTQYWVLTRTSLETAGE
ncbi:hypothetical protein JSY36_16470 [Bacillus sp. H-16]|uniref:hypothetical protein n=1 Tax=Alteribacter salitolerans TaxID=2912333 RepID=UPI001962BB63|nr:hypothetical protein [Alteribacter salitolerans]MBM7097328.1 hypothetical protein [Alteribacter salitolerans]